MQTSFFDIESVAIIGASEAEGKIGNTLLKNLSTFEGRAYGVNPKGGEFNNIKFSTSVEKLPEIVDIAVIVIPARFVLESLEECGQKGIKRVIIISAGFKEVGNTDAENAITELSKKYGIQILGPNCLGYIDAHKNLNLSFGGKGVKAGNIAMVSQSGAMAVALTDWAASTGIGFSKLISMGNKADLDENDLLESLALDEATDVIVLYLESIEEGRKFYEITRRLSKNKPIIMVKSGRSTRGKQAASSHTGALSGENEVLEVVLKDTGIHSTSSLEDFFLWAEAFSSTVGKNIPEGMTIVTNAGGPGVMTTDHCELNGVSLVNFSEEEQLLLKNNMPAASSMSNPLDIIGDATSKTYEQMLKNISTLERDFATLILVTPQTVTDVDTIVEQIISQNINNPDKFIMTSFMGGESVKKAGFDLQKNNILNYGYPKKGIVTYSELLKQSKWAKKEEGEKASLFEISSEEENRITQKLLKEKKLCGPELLADILRAFGVNFVEEKLISDISELDTIFDSSNDSDYVAKISSKDIAHKTDCGGVVLGVKRLEESRRVYIDMLKNVKNHHPEADIAGVTFQKMLPKSKEVFIGMKRDISFGEVLLVGIGGIFVNIYEDVAMKLAPVNKTDTRKMFESLKGYPILKGARGEESIDFDSLIDTVTRIQSIFKTFPQVREIDINPAFANKDGAIIVDAKFYL